MAWWLNRTGQPEGPYEDGQILHMIHSGQLRGGNICQHGANAWMPIEQHPEKGKITGDVIGFELENGKPIGGFRFLAESSEVPENQWNSPEKVLDDDLRASLKKALPEAASKTPKP